MSPTLFAIDFFSKKNLLFKKRQVKLLNVTSGFRDPPATKHNNLDEGDYDV